MGPSILITGPQPPPAFTFTAATLPLTGTAADASGVQAVTWTSDRGGSGTATGTTAWSAAIPLLEGPNRITVAARDPVGNLSQAEVLVTYLPPDTTPPLHRARRRDVSRGIRGQSRNGADRLAVDRNGDGGCEWGV